MDELVNKAKHIPIKLFRGRERSIIKISGVIIKIVSEVISSFLAKKGFLINLLAIRSMIVYRNVPITAIATYLLDVLL